MNIEILLAKSMTPTRLLHPQLHPKVKQKGIELIKKMHSLGILIIFTCSVRTIQEQNELYAQGRTKIGKKVTWVTGGNSFHNWGLALDFVRIHENGSVDWNLPLEKVGEEAEKLGFEWGGRWKETPDFPHIQMRFGLSIADLKAGKKPKIKEL